MEHGSSKEFNLNGFQKLVIAAGADSWYANVSDSAPRTQSVERIESKRTDSQGDIWYQLLHTTSGGLSKGEKLQMFVKLSKGSTVLELVYRGNLPDSESSRFPKAIDPNDVSYGIYYRAEK